MNEKSDEIAQNVKSPLISIAMPTYNQSNYVEEAVESILAQTYQPLEIVISDDNSTDDTFERINSQLKKYSGPHTVILRSNMKNLGIARHISVMHSICSGVLVVHAAGDDISCPERVAKLYEGWSKNEFKADMLFSDCSKIDSWGTLISRPFFGMRNDIYSIDGDEIPTRSLGATTAVTRRLYDIFGDVIYSITAEDCVLESRARMAGGLLYVAADLVEYRLHQSASNRSPKAGYQRLAWEAHWVGDQLQRKRQLRVDRKKIHYVAANSIEDIYHQFAFAHAKKNLYALDPP